MTVSLPLWEQGAVAEGVGVVSRPSVREGRKRGQRILVVDDNPDAASMLALGLDFLGYDTRVVHDGPAALEAAADFRPEVALLDIGLPVMDGYELARRLRGDKNLPGLRLIAVTGYGQVNDRHRAEDAGFDAHMVKPVNMEELAALIGRLADPGPSPSPAEWAH